MTREVGEAGLAGLVNYAGVAIPGPLEYLDLDALPPLLAVRPEAPELN